jgi:hypothetical protein
MEQQELFASFLKAYDDLDISKIVKCFEEGLELHYTDGVYNSPIDLLNNLPSKLLDEYVLCLNLLTASKNYILSFENFLYSVPLPQRVFDEVIKNNDTIVMLNKINNKLMLVIDLIMELKWKEVN